MMNSEPNQVLFLENEDTESKSVSTNTDDQTYSGFEKQPEEVIPSRRSANIQTDTVRDYQPNDNHFQSEQSCVSIHHIEA